MASTERVSVASDGVQGNGNSSESYGRTSISADGRFVAFESEASNLVPGDTNSQYDYRTGGQIGGRDLFVHDRATGATERVDVGPGGAQASANGYLEFAPSLSADGRYVAFVSEADSLVPGDSNNTADIFVRDRTTGTTELVSAVGAIQTNVISSEPSISADGRFVAYTSEANNLVAGDTNNSNDVFVFDRVSHTTERVSVTTSGAQAGGDSIHPSVSGNGRYVAFSSTAMGLVQDKHDIFEDIFVHDRVTGTTEQVNVPSFGDLGQKGQSTGPSISADGRFVIFSSFSSNLVAGDTNNGYDAANHYQGGDVFVRDLTTGTTERVSLATSGAEGNGNSDHASISADGRYVTFLSTSSNLVDGDTNNAPDVFVHDRETGRTERVSLSDDGAEASSSSFAPAISADGHFVVFNSDAGNLVAGDTNGRADTFVAETPMDLVLKGGAGDDYLAGGAGYDIVVGGDGNDELHGGDGNDFVAGEAGIDIVKGDAGDDFVDGGAGNDTVTGGLGNDEVHGGDGNDFVAGEAGNDIVKGDAGDDFVDGGAGNDTVTGGLGNDVVHGGEGNDFVAGEDGNDIVKGDAGNDLVEGGAGNDIVTGGIGDDMVLGGDGNDFVAGDDGRDIVKGGAGDDFVDGGAGDDIVTGGTGDDTVHGGDGNDFVAGEDGNDIVKGDAGNDTLIGGTGNDYLVGGPGDDTFVFQPSFGRDTIADFKADASHDVIEFDHTLFADFSSVVAHSQQVGSDVVISYDASNTVTLSNVALSSLHADDFHFV